jgi:hypothetical protein
MEERADAGAIAREQQPLAGAVPERDRELPVQILDEAIAVTLVEMQDDFGIGIGAEDVAEAPELRTKLNVVEDLAIEADDERTAPHRLLAAGGIDDRKPDVREPDAVLEMDPAAVGSPMREQRQHPFEQLPIRAGVSRRADETRDAAHEPLPVPQWPFTLS